MFDVDMRERQRAEYADHWSDVNIMGGRAYYDFDQHSLVIKHVKISDEGFYKCRMDFKQTPTKNFEIKLIVVVPVENITIVEAIRSTEFGEYTLVLPPVTEGSSLTATCIAFGVWNTELLRMDEVDKYDCENVMA
ncbi:hypothetical protein PGB90_002640 [Kerria lacca]